MGEAVQCSWFCSFWAVLGVFGGLALFVGAGWVVLLLPVCTLWTCTSATCAAAEEEVALHLIDHGVVGVLHPYNRTFSCIGSGDDANFQCPRVGDAVGGAHQGIAGT